MEVGIEAGYSLGFGCLGIKGQSLSRWAGSGKSRMAIGRACVCPEPGCDPAVGLLCQPATFCLRAFASGKSLAWLLPEPSLGVWGLEVGQEWAQGIYGPGSGS